MGSIHDPYCLALVTRDPITGYHGVASDPIRIPCTYPTDTLAI
jgi:hypothetical protein